MTSLRVFASVRMQPRKAEVCVKAPAARAPRIVMHQVLRFNEHRHAARIQVFFDKVRNLRRQTLLHLRTPRKAIDNAGKFGKPDDLAVARDIRNMTLAENGSKWCSHTE